MTVVGIYYGAFIVAVFVLGLNLTRNRKSDSVLVLLEIFVSLHTLGKALMCTSEGLELAILAMKLHYIGGIFAPFLLVIVVARICNIKIRQWVVVAMSVISSALYCCVLTVGHSTIYYESVSLARGAGYSYLEKSYGPVHTLYVVLMIGYMLALLGITVYAFFNKKDVPVTTVAVTALLGIGTLLSYVLSRAFESPIEWETLATLITTVSVGIMSDRIEMFDMTTNISRTMERMHEYGYIVFNKKYHFVRSNSFAVQVFPEIKQWRPEEHVRREETIAYKEIVENLKNWNKTKEDKIIEVHDQFVELYIRDIVFHNKKVGCLIEIIDKTYEQKYLNTVQNYNTMLQKEVEEKTADILRIKDNMVLGMAAMVEGRDNSTGGHIQRTSSVVEVFAKRLKKEAKYGQLTDEFLDSVIKAAPMHDLGKITVDDKILRKRGKFTEEEYDEMKKHATEGAKIVKRILKGNNDKTFERIATNMAHYHHEKWDGTGYPKELVGEEIPIEARIMAFADVYDALVSRRCYKESFSHEKAVELIKKDLGSHFDPELGKVFLECKEELIELYSEYDDE